MRGTATRVSTAQEGAETVLRFMLTSESGESAAIEMRGARITGLIGDGDEIALPRSVERDSDGLLRPTELRNSTTGAMVRTHRPGLLARASRPALGLGASTVATLFLTWGFHELFPASAADSDQLAPSDDVAAVVMAGLFAAVAVSLLWRMVSKRAGTRVSRWAIAAGVPLGVAVAVLWFT